MGDKQQSQHSRPEEIIAAFDRERQQAQELHRRHTEHVRNARRRDRPASEDRSDHQR